MSKAHKDFIAVRTFRLVTIAVVLHSLLGGLVGTSNAQTAKNCTVDIVNVIIDKADKLCGIVNTHGEANSKEVQGQIRAQLNVLASKVVDLGGSGTERITSDSYQNVLRSELGRELRDVRVCRLHIYDSLLGILCPKESPQSSETLLDATDEVEEVAGTNDWHRAGVFSKYNWVADFRRVYQNTTDSAPVQCHLRIRGVLEGREKPHDVIRVGQAREYDFRLVPRATQSLSGRVGAYGFNSEDNVIDTDDDLQCWYEK